MLVYLMTKIMISKILMEIKQLVLLVVRWMMMAVIEEILMKVKIFVLVVV